MESAPAVMTLKTGTKVTRGSSFDNEFWTMSDCEIDVDSAVDMTGIGNLEALESLELLGGTSSMSSFPSAYPTSYPIQNQQGYMFPPPTMQYLPFTPFGYVAQPGIFFQYPALQTVAPHSAPAHVQSFVLPSPRAQPQTLQRDVPVCAQEEWNEAVAALDLSMLGTPQPVSGGENEITRPSTAPLRGTPVHSSVPTLDWLQIDPYSSSPPAPPSPSKSPRPRRRSNSNLRQAKSNPNFGHGKGVPTKLVETKTVDDNGTTWVNFTARDAREIMGGVAPSGASKRRKKEERERERERLEKERLEREREKNKRRIKKRMSMG
ncbi:hypothetical protein BT69DRAFT_293959 [Atractiella rhizophila]|nr:hypothetical protein BT69DRAFT_293959 [Atractiella rhizophila]